jgi:hypothetical protein
LAALGLVIFDAVEDALGDISTTGAALLLTLLHRPGLTATELASVAGVTQPQTIPFPLLVSDWFLSSHAGLLERFEKKLRSENPAKHAPVPRSGGVHS